jgi:hypothetical protein
LGDVATFRNISALVQRVRRHLQTARVLETVEIGVNESVPLQDERHTLHHRRPEILADSRNSVIACAFDARSSEG